MIYPTKQAAKKCRVRVKNFSGGVNLREQPAVVEENQCSNTKFRFHQQFPAHGFYIVSSRNRPK